MQPWSKSSSRVESPFLWDSGASKPAIDKIIAKSRNKKPSLSSTYNLHPKNSSKSHRNIAIKSKAKKSRDNLFVRQNDSTNLKLYQSQDKQNNQLVDSLLKIFIAKSHQSEQQKQILQQIHMNSKKKLAIKAMLNKNYSLHIENVSQSPTNAKQYKQRKQMLNYLQMHQQKLVNSLRIQAGKCKLKQLNDHDWRDQIVSLFCYSNHRDRSEGEELRSQGVDLVTEIYKKIDEQRLVIHSLFDCMDKLYQDCCRVDRVRSNCPSSTQFYAMYSSVKDTLHYLTDQYSSKQSESSLSAKKSTGEVQSTDKSNLQTQLHLEKQNLQLMKQLHKIEQQFECIVEDKLHLEQKLRKECLRGEQDRLKHYELFKSLKVQIDMLSRKNSQVYECLQSQSKLSRSRFKEIKQIAQQSIQQFEIGREQDWGQQIQACHQKIEELSQQVAAKELEINKYLRIIKELSYQQVAQSVEIAGDLSSHGRKVLTEIQTAQQQKQRLSVQSQQKIQNKSVVQQSKSVQQYKSLQKEESLRNGSLKWGQECKEEAVEIMISQQASSQSELDPSMPIAEKQQVSVTKMEDEKREFELRIRELQDDCEHYRHLSLKRQSELEETISECGMLLERKTDQIMNIRQQLGRQIMLREDLFHLYSRQIARLQPDETKGRKEMNASQEQTESQEQAHNHGEIDQLTIKKEPDSLGNRKEINDMETDQLVSREELGNLATQEGVSRTDQITERRKVQGLCQRIQWELVELRKSKQLLMLDSRTCFDQWKDTLQQYTSELVALSQQHISLKGDHQNTKKDSTSSKQQQIVQVCFEHSLDNKTQTEVQTETKVDFNTNTVETFSTPQLRTFPQVYQFELQSRNCLKTSNQLPVQSSPIKQEYQSKMQSSAHQEYPQEEASSFLEECRLNSSHGSHSSTVECNNFLAISLLDLVNEQAIVDEMSSLKNQLAYSHDLNARLENHIRMLLSKNGEHQQSRESVQEQAETSLHKNIQLEKIFDF